MACPFCSVSIPKLGLLLLQSSEAKPLELAFTALARMAAANGDGDAALEATQQGLNAGVPARLRAFVPALLAYAVAGQHEKAFKVCIQALSRALSMVQSALQSPDWRLLFASHCMAIFCHSGSVDCN